MMKIGIVKRVGDAIIIGTVLFAALLVAVDQSNAARAHQECLKNADQSQRIVGDMEANGMQGKWHVMQCLQKDFG